MPIKVLVTGAGGQLGRTFQDLAPKNKELIDFTFVTKEVLDISKIKDIERLFNSHSFDYCINCAAYTNVEQAEKAPDIAYKINAESVKNLAEVCKDYSVILVHISTDYVFDGTKGFPYTIDDVPNPINEYGKSKLLGEQYIQRILDKYFIVRTSWLYSKKHGNNFYRIILEKVKKESELYITDEQKGCPTNAINLANYLILLINAKRCDFGIYHYCDGIEMTWYDFADQILNEHNLLDRINLVKVRNYSTFAQRPKYSVLVNNKFKNQ